MEGGVDKGREEENFAEKGSDAVFFIENVYALLKDLIDELVIIELSNLNNMAYQFQAFVYLDELQDGFLPVSYRDSLVADIIDD